MDNNIVDDLRSRANYERNSDAELASLLDEAAKEIEKLLEYEWMYLDLCDK